MANKQRVENKFISFCIPRETIYKLTQMAGAQGVSRSKLCMDILAEATKGEKLTAENSKKIKSEVAKEKRRRAKYIF